MVNKLLRLFSGVILYFLIYIQVGCEQPNDQLKEMRNEIKDLIHKILLLHDSVERLAVSFEVVSNTLDGSVRSECEAQGEVEGGREYKAWISFGEVNTQGKQGWEAVASSTHCRNGTFDEASTLLGRALGIPYIMGGNDGGQVSTFDIARE